jgi:lysophospholipase L1-like esterase
MRDRNHRELSLTAAMLALAPILLCQGKYVRRVTPKLPEADGLRFGESGLGKPLRLLVLGDSAAAGVGVNTQQEALAGHLVKGLERIFRVFWKVEAQTGATTRTTIARLKAAAPEKFNAVAISLGVNEVTCGRRVRKAQDQQAEWFAQTGFAEAQSVCLRKFRRYAPDILSLA